MMELFDYQQEMLERVQDAFRLHQSVMAQMPTGTGKTYLLAAVVKCEEQRVKKHRSATEGKANPCVWIVAHRRELVSQIEETLARFGLPSSADDDFSFVRVMSIQWLSRHYLEMKDAPCLIVIDEAHHATADTYAEMMNAFPKAKKLGLTATPCRMNGRGFTDLFDVLLMSWSVERFIAKGRLSMYDFYSIKPDSDDQRCIDSLNKRGADGDYQQKELMEVMDVKPSLQRLCVTVKRYVPRKKGIVYAISIEHAEHIAEFYRENGISAVAISSKTPLLERETQIESFKEGMTQVLVSVDLFSEGFDCPDVEFIQLARPTLSLSKYLQMVGRGLRVTKGKKFCVVLDNVGLYRRFGLPSDERDWQGMFEGRTWHDDPLRKACMRINSMFYRLECWGMDNSDEMTRIIAHNHPLRSGGDGDDIVEDKRGWVDVRNGVRFARRPQCVRLMGVDFCTEDGRRLYPRIRSKFIDEKAYLNLKTLELQVGRGINWKRRFISCDAPDKVYQLMDKVGCMRLYADDKGRLYAQGSPDMGLTPIQTQDEMNDYCRKFREREKRSCRAHMKLYRHGMTYPIQGVHNLENEAVRVEENGLWYVSQDDSGESFWVDNMTGVKHYNRPMLLERGFVKLLKDGDWFYVRNIPDLADKPFRNWEIVADDNICVLDNDFLFLRKEPRAWFRIFKRTEDFSYFVVKEHKLADDDAIGCPSAESDYSGLPDVIITQYGNEGLKLESNGVPYVPTYQVVRKDGKW